MREDSSEPSGAGSVASGERSVAIGGDVTGSTIITGDVHIYGRKAQETLSPITVLRQATKLIVGPVAQALTGQPWKKAKQRLVTRASKLPHANHLDTALMEERVEDLIRLTREVRILLAAYRIEPIPGQLEALKRHAGPLAAYLIRIYRLEAGEAPELEWLRSLERAER